MSRASWENNCIKLCCLTIPPVQLRLQQHLYPRFTQAMKAVAIDFCHLIIRYGCDKIPSDFEYQPDCR